MIGLALVYFLVHKLDISVRAAVVGDWRWKKAFGSLREINVGSTLVDLFDEIDNAGDVEIDPD
jgi:hypothetical protein